MGRHKSSSPRKTGNSPSSRLGRELAAEREAALGRYVQGDPAPLEAHCRKILARDAEDHFANINLGVINAGRGRFLEAVGHYRAALRKRPDSALAHANIARSLCELRRWQDAYRHSKEATRFDPANPHGWTNLSWAANMLARYAESEAAARKALAITPKNLPAMNNLASALKEQGRVHEAVAVYKDVLALDPGYQLAYANLMLALLYDDRASVGEIVEAAKAFGEQFESEDKTRGGAWTEPDPCKKLRVGFLSPDFNDHAVMYFAEPLIARLDREQFEIHAYYLYPEGDAVTERLRRFVDGFAILGGMTPEAQAQRIRDDRIDVLIDLAGHTAKSGLSAMTWKPAPVQGTWLGYPGTTGMRTIDFRITDTVADACAQEGEYTERLLGLPPPFCVYRPSIRNPLRRYWAEYDVRPTPALKNGYITFGCCNNIAKLTPDTLTIWGEILKALPSARLLIEGKSLNDPAIAGPFSDKCVRHGIPGDRLILVARDTARQYLTYHDIDIALDPFPLTGGTTTADLLWCGIPMVTMEGASFRSRMSMSFLAAVGMSEWVASNSRQYRDIALGLAADIATLNDIRMGLRSRVEKGTMMDEGRFAHLFGSAIRQAWQDWCVAQGAARSVPTENDWEIRPPLVFLENGRLSLADAHLELSRMLSGKDWKGARSLATRVIESVPGDRGALVALAEAEWAEGNAQRALDYLRNAIRVAPGALPFYDRLAYWLRTLNLNEDAARVARARENVARQLNNGRDVPVTEVVQ